MAQVEVLAKDYKSKAGTTAPKGSVFVRKGGKLLERPEGNPLVAGEVLASGGVDPNVSTGSDLTGRQAFENFNTAAKAKLERFQQLSAQQSRQGALSMSELQQADAGVVLEESGDDVKGFSPGGQQQIREGRRAGFKAQMGILQSNISDVEGRQDTFIKTWQAMREVMTDLYKDDLDAPPTRVLEGYKKMLEDGTLSLKDIPVEDLRHVLPLIDTSKLPKTEEEIDIFNDADYNRVRIVRDKDGNIRTEILGKVPRPKTGGGGGGTAGERTQAKINATREKVLGIIESDIGEDSFTSIGTYRKALSASGLPSDDFNDEYGQYLSPKSRATYGIGKTTNAFRDEEEETDKGGLTIVEAGRKAIADGEDEDAVRAEVEARLVDAGYSSTTAASLAGSL